MIEVFKSVKISEFRKVVLEKIAVKVKMISATDHLHATG